ncbi:MAG: GNAT family N-acetyltransferase [candidate division Zixibacteria bacterium]|nr:GNAT family N-acetyltransferase [candidate division Zixibacteria bacterium]
MIIREVTQPSTVEDLISIAATYQRSADQLATLRRQLTKELSEAGYNRFLYVGYEDDRAVGMIQIIVRNADNDPELADGDAIAHLHNMQVRKDCQKRGLGTQLMDFVEDTARKMGKQVLTLGVDDINERAVKLYQNRGYTIFKTEPGRVPEEKCFCMRLVL